MARKEDQADAIWKALGDPKRRQILDLLRKQPRTVGELCAVFEKTHSRFAVMKHLGLLREAGLIAERKEGRRTWNHLNAVPLRRVYERWVTQYESAWSGALLGLERAALAKLEREKLMPSDREKAGCARDASGKPEVGEFLIAQQLELAVPRETAFAALLDVDGWWCHCYARSGKPKLTLEPFAGGRFYESSDEGEAFFGHVTYIKPSSHLRLSGPLGMGSLPVMSVYEFELEERAAKTLLKLTHRAYGLLDPAWRQAHEEGWKQLWTSLKKLAEEGVCHERVVK